MLLAFSLLLGIGACVVSSRLPTRYQATVTLFVRKEPESAQEYYTYDGYYAQKVAEEYADTVVGLLESEGVRRRAGEEKWGEPSKKTLRRLQKSIQVEKTAPQLVTLDVVWESEETAEELVSILAGLAREKVEFSEDQDAQGVEVVTLDSQPVVETLEPHRLLNSLVGAGAGLLLAVVLVWIKEYFG